jgi:aspartyl-tRNA(Asn)/glutamyl-tRNA(Gln) amidotransferase subunit A
MDPRDLTASLPRSQRVQLDRDHRYSGIAELSDLLRSQEVSPVELVSECLKRIEAYNPKLNAFITVTAERALEYARKAEGELKDGEWRGPLHGIPVAVKDFFDTAGIKTTAAFEHFRNRVPAKDAEVVRLLKEAGAIVVGKTNMHELGMGTTSVVSCFGPVHNPWNIDHVAGGSSGGSAAAIAAGLCYATVDTDAVGSCRLPAACCGVIGFKPTFGLVSTRGILDGEPVDEQTARTIAYIGHAAFTCRTAEDAAIVLNALATPDVSRSEFRADYRAAFENMTRPRIGVTKNYEATPEVRHAFEKVVEGFHSLGYKTSDVEVPFDRAGFNLEHIEQDRKTIAGSLFADVDVLLLPTTTDVAPSIEEVQKSGNPQAVSPGNTYFCNYYGLPAISLPCGFSQNGLPIGFQIVGPQWSEGVILNVARAFQQLTPWHTEHPTDLGEHVS